MSNQIIALDIGSVRVGVSISDGLGLLAHPLMTLKWRNLEVFTNDLEKLIIEKNIEVLVIGVPYTLKGEHSQQTKNILQIIDHLKTCLKIKIETIDERLTTKMAETILKNVGKKASKQRHIIDQIAAVNILQTYLDKTRI